MVIIVMRYDMNKKIYQLERKIEVLEIHIFPEEYITPPSETKI